MRPMKGAISITIGLILCAVSYPETGRTVEPFRPTEILGNMPVNSDSRCTGIALVAEALLEGERISGEECEPLQTLAKSIFENAANQATIRYRSTLCLETGAAPIHSRVALNRLSTEVTNLYKQRHLELVATAEGRRRIVAAQQTMVRTARELDAILDA